MAADPKTGKDEGRRDTEGRPVIPAVEEKNKEEQENKEKPVDPE